MLNDAKKLYAYSLTKYTMEVIVLQFYRNHQKASSLLVKIIIIDCSELSAEPF